MRVHSLVEPSLEALQERFEKLVVRREANHLSEAHRRGITNKFAKKSLQELQWIVRELDNCAL